MKNKNCRSMAHCTEKLKGMTKIDNVGANLRPYPMVGGEPYPSKLKYDNGITLIMLVVTIVILLILATVTVTISVNQLDNMKLKDFYTKLEIAQSGVGKIVEINESYKDNNGDVIYLKDLGTTPTDDQKALIETLGLNSSKFKYFTSEQVKDELAISGVELNLLIDFDNRKIINPEGIEIKGEKYYMLESQRYSVSIDEEKNKADVDFSYTVEKYGTDSYKIKLSPINIGDINEGIIKYKKSDLNYWTVSNNNEIIIKQLANYDIIYVDANNNSKQKTITLSLDNNGNVVASEV